MREFLYFHFKLSFHFQVVLMCYGNDTGIKDGTSLARAFPSLHWRAGAASLALCWQLAHLVLQALKVVQPAESEAKWRPSHFLAARFPLL